MALPYTTASKPLIRCPMNEDRTTRTSQSKIAPMGEIKVSRELHQLVIKGDPREAANLITRKLLNPTTDGKDPINVLSNPSKALTVVALHKSRIRKTKSNQPIPQDEIPKLFGLNAVQGPTLSLFLRIINAIEITNNKSKS